MLTMYKGKVVRTSRIEKFSIIVRSFRIPLLALDKSRKQK